MTVDIPHSDHEIADASWRQIEDLVDEIASLAKSEVSRAEFHAALLDRLVVALAAAGGAIWMLDREGQLALEYQVNLSRTPLSERPADHQSHHRLLRLAVDNGEPKLVPPQSGPAGENAVSNPTDFLLLVCPLFEEQTGPVGVVEVFQRTGTAPAAQQGALRLLASFCELATDFYGRGQLRQLQSREELRNRFDEFSKQVHRSLDLDQTAYAIANEGCRFIGCDRLSVLIPRRSGCRLLAVGGTDGFERRANVVRQLERLVSAVLAAEMSLFYPGGSEKLPPQIKDPLRSYLDESHARLLVVAPLKEDAEESTNDDRSAIGALVIEQFDAGPDEQMRNRIEAACQHGRLALRNALEHRKLPIPRVVRRAGWFLRLQQLPRTVMVLLALAAVVAGMVFVPADFEIEASGRLQPKLRRDIFAPRDGVVTELLADDEKQVHAGQRLVVLRDPQLDLEFKRVWGDMQTARKRLSAVQARRVESSVTNSEGPARPNQFSAEESEIKELLKSLEQQYEILKQQQDELTVRSPIDGHVLTWNVQQLLKTRPVRSGQILMRVADPKGPWVLELLVADDRIGHVLQAQRELGNNLRVSFLLATEPGITYEELIDRIAMSTEPDVENNPTVRVHVNIDRSKVPHLRPGATVAARIHCGRRSIGYVWLHELFEAVQTRLLF